MPRTSSPAAKVAIALGAPVFALLLLATLFVTTASAQERKSFSETYALDTSGEVVIDTYKGSIRVATWDRAEVRVEVVIEADDQDELVEKTEVRIVSDRGRLSLETDYEEAKRSQRRGLWRGGNYSLPFAHYRITMPSTARLVIDDYKSDIEVEGLAAELTLETYKGSVEVKGQAGPVELETYKGQVTLAYARYAASAFDTYKGTIALYLPEGAGFDLAADLGRKGDLHSDFEIMTSRRRWNGDDDKTVAGSVAGGGPRLAFETYKGELKLARR